MTKNIQLSGGHIVLVSEEDYDLVSQHRWHASKVGNTLYAKRSIGSQSKGTRKIILMHRIILPSIPLIDHIDGNGLNNVRDNLRRASRSENARNRLPNQLYKSSKFKGVHWDKWANGWRAMIEVNRTRINLGRYKSEIEAAQAYDQGALKYFGTFARTNQMMGLYVR